MASYTVKSGDTLSGIGARYGVDWHTISGYRSGNPNLIFPGEVVSWGGGSPAPAPAPAAPTGPSAADIAAQQYADWQSKVNTGYGDITKFDQNAKNPLDMYNASLDKLGIGDARTRVTGLRESMLNTENLIRNVEGDVAGATQDALVTEGQKRSLVGMKRQPLEQQAGIEGRNLEVALADYHDIMNEGKAQTEMEYNFQKDQRQALMDRLQVAIGQASSASERQKWQLEYDRLKAKDAQEQSNWEKDYALKQQQLALSARSGGGSGGGGGGSGSSSPSIQEQWAMAASDIKAWGGGKGVGGDGYANPNAYNAAKAQWVDSGGSGTTFDSHFAGLRNPKQPAGQYRVGG